MVEEGLGRRTASGSEAITLAVAHGDATRAPFFAQMGPEEALMSAVRAVFPAHSSLQSQPQTAIAPSNGASTPGDRFYDDLTDLIKEKDALMVSSVKRGRVNVDEGIDALMAVREKLEPMVDACSDVGEQANALLGRITLAERQVADTTKLRQNVNATLEVIARARRLVLIYARVEKLIGGGRLHTAARLIAKFEEERKGFQSLVRSEDGAEGEGEPFFSRVIPDGVYLRAIIKAKLKLTFRAWMMSLVKAAEDIGRRAVDTLSTEAGWVPDVVDISDEADLSSLEETRRDEDGRPLIIVRPLLSCLLVERDFGRLPEFREEYLRSRFGQLDAFMRLDPSADQDEIEECLACVAGFFITEQAISRHAAVGLTTEKELREKWESAQRNLRDTLLMLEKPRSNPMTRLHVQSYVERFAQCVRQHGYLPALIDEWSIAGFTLPVPPSASELTIGANETGDLDASPPL